MRLRFVKSDTVARLWDEVPENLECYRIGAFNWISTDITSYFETDIEYCNNLNQLVQMPNGNGFSEAENCQIVYECLKRLTPYHARDERLWVYLCHTELLEYARKRWPIPMDDDKAIKHIRTHFFGRDLRQIERDNAVSRLWWMANLCNRVQGLELKQSLEVFLYRSDVRANIVERPTTSQSEALFGGIIKKLHASFTGDRTLFERETFRKYMKKINSLGGYILLDVLSEDHVLQLLDKVECEEPRPS